MQQITSDPPAEPQPPQPPHGTLSYATLPPPNPKRTATTVLGIIAIVIAAAGLLASAFNALTVMAGANKTSPILQSVSESLLYTDAVLQLICKLGLLWIGILMLLRRSSARPVAVMALIIAIISSGIAVAIVQQMTFPNSEQALGANIGVSGITMVAVALYSSLTIYLMTKATRKEFAAVSATRTPPPPANAEFDDQPPPIE